MKELGLARYDAMCNAIAVCVRVDEVKDIRNKARAMEVYAAQALNMEAERKACEIRIRAERRVGELLKEMKATGQREGRGRPSSKTSNASTFPLSESMRDAHSSAKATLGDLGVSRTQASDWQKLAEIPEERFEAEVTQPNQKPTTEGILASVAAKPPKPDVIVPADALTAWGRICDFERKGMIRRPLPELFEQMTPSMRDDIVRAVPVVIAWLEHFVESQRPQRKKA